MSPPSHGSSANLNGISASSAASPAVMKNRSPSLAGRTCLLRPLLAALRPPTPPAGARRWLTADVIAWTINQSIYLSEITFTQWLIDCSGLQLIAETQTAASKDTMTSNRTSLDRQAATDIYWHHLAECWQLPILLYSKEIKCKLNNGIIMRRSVTKMHRQRHYANAMLINLILLLLPPDTKLTI